MGCLAHTQVCSLAYAQAKYFTSMPVSDDTFTPDNDDTFTHGSNYMSTTKCVSSCAFTLVYMVALPGVDMSNLEKNYVLSVWPEG